ncbi:MAG: GtrA family protein [Oceanisphaera sp.]|uniref:GtrA family protein n=1 Tax=Oceanisphaera sp. TaxID=1929979 RepID=UPI003C7282A4
MLKSISLYSLIGVLNTTLHWVVFYILYKVGVEQAYSNLAAFICAATFSFFMNAKFNFKVEINIKKYFIFLIGMGMISFVVGFFADTYHLNPLVTLVMFSASSFILGYIYSRFVFLGEL